MRDFFFFFFPLGDETVFIDERSVYSSLPLGAQHNTRRSKAKLTD